MIKRIKVDRNLLFLEHLLLSIECFAIYDEDISLSIKRLYKLVSERLYSGIEHKEDFDHTECEIVYYY